MYNEKNIDHNIAFASGELLEKSLDQYCLNKYGHLKIVYYNFGFNIVSWL